MDKDIDFSKLHSDNGEEKYFLIKELVERSKKDASQIYLHFDEIALLLNDKKDVFRWNAMKIIGNVAVADSENKIKPLLPHFYDLLKSGNMISANNAITTLSKIALVKKEEIDEIVSNLLKIDLYKFDNSDYENIITGKAITALIALFQFTKLQDEIKQFALNHIKKGRPETLARAEELLKELEKQQN